ncbi:hypothetical protein Moror_14178 [Moniliophthora roreri MCA 2997]|uniref:Uncharacterized protein n=1 Tax=Moniliophthora roreri (strain MCA 2997) TaxID=1381753 RepID=V2XQH3_MONRO|nr:hypothetical protein Moror_14178 [Moniliophthora roreri MCA 2997]
MRAYYHDNLQGDRSLPRDTVLSRPVPSEVLQALGCKSLPLDESSRSQNPEERLKHFAQQCGFSSKRELFTYDIFGTGLLGNPNMTSDEKIWIVNEKLVSRQTEGSFRNGLLPISRG